jgi:hypothetical protein
MPLDGLLSDHPTKRGVDRRPDSGRSGCGSRLLEERVVDLGELRRGGDDLEAARRANRELMAELNRARPLP